MFMFPKFSISDEITYFQIFIGELFYKNKGILET